MFLIRWILTVGFVVIASACNAAALPDSPPLDDLYRVAIRHEERLELDRATALYEQILARSDHDRDSRLRAEQGMNRVRDLREEFALSEADLQKQLAKTYRDYRPAELADLERRGWILARPVDGVRRYSILNPRNLGFFSTEWMARDSAGTVGFRKFAEIFLEKSARLDRLRRAATLPQAQVDPQPYRYTVRATVKAEDLPPGKTVRAWFPCPLLTAWTQNLRVLEVRPAGALRHSPDFESNLGVAYLEAPRPDQGELRFELTVALDNYDSDFDIDPRQLPAYDTTSELYRRFTRSEQQMELTDELRALARSIVADEKNAHRRARRLYDWVCDHVKYNYVWRWRDATFTYGCASEEVRKRRVGDCVIQSVFYAALCRAVGLPARVLNGPIFPPGMKNDHVWAEVYFPLHGWLPVDVTYSEVASMVPGLTETQRATIRNFFFGRMDRYRLCMQRNDLAQPLVPPKLSPRRRVTMFVRPELECGQRDVQKCVVSWDCVPAPR